MPKITEIWAWIVTEPDGGEGIPAIGGLGGMMMPLVGADEARIRSLEPAARATAALSGLPVRLVRFTELVEVETRH